MLDDFTNRMGTIEKAVLASDSGGGSTTTWTPQGAIRMRLTTVGSRMAVEYLRAGFENTVRVQAQDRLPRAIDGKRTLGALFRSQAQYRILYQDRTLSPIGFPNPDGSVQDVGGVFLIDCIETPLPVGYMDLDTNG